MSALCMSCLRKHFAASLPGSLILKASKAQPQSLLNQVSRTQTRRWATTSSSSPPKDFTSLADVPPRLVRSGRRHGPGLIILALIPITAFALGTWQVYRLEWKTDLIARFEDRLIRPPLPLPLTIDTDAVKDFDYRRIEVKGEWRHDLEMLIGPRMREGKEGVLVVTPLERSDSRARDGSGKSRVLVCRGWIAKDFIAQRKRVDADALPKGEVLVQGLLREPWKKNMFTPDNRPERGDWFFPDVSEMAKWSGSQEVWVEETMSRIGVLTIYAEDG